jgi:hypothetical protein
MNSPNQHRPDLLKFAGELAPVNEVVALLRRDLEERP